MNIVLISWIVASFLCDLHFAVILIYLFFKAEEGEVLSDHYKLIPVDLRDIPRLDEVICKAQMDPRYVF